MRDPYEIMASHMLKLPQVSCNVRHLFYPGLYVREMTVAAGVTVIGHVHKHSHLNIMLKGAMRLIKEDGSYEPEIHAPQIFFGPPGRKSAFALEDTIWLNVYATNERDVETLEETLFETSPALEAHKAELDADYSKMLTDIGLDAAVVRTQSEIDLDLIPFPVGEYKVKVGQSRIEGKGLIATSDINQGEIICAARIGYNRTPAGRYTNHSRDPNAQMVDMDGDMYLIALKDINGCKGGLDGEEVTVDYRQSYALKHRMLK